MSGRSTDCTSFWAEPLSASRPIWGRQGRSFVAAFASTFPAMTGATFVLIYLNGGSEHLVTYAKNLLWFVPPWLAYVGCMIYGVERVGFWLSMAGSLVLYMCCVGLVKFLAR